MIPAYFMGLKIESFRKNLLYFFKSKQNIILIESIIKLSHIYNEKKINSTNLVKSNFFGNSIERNRFIKNTISLLPIGIKGFILFVIKYFLLLGFLDGKVGFIYSFLNSFWFHTLSDAKKYESSIIKINKNRK